MRWRRHLSLLGFGLVLLGVAMASSHGLDAVSGTVVWLPTGVAMAGVWMFGLRSAWVVMLAIALHRLLLGGGAQVIALGALGTASEAALGVWILRRVELDPRFARLRDVLGLCLAAAAAPLASIACSWLSRALPGTPFEQPFHAGWLAWWRMNALGVLTVVPLILVWRAWSTSGLRVRAVIEALGLVVGVAVLVWGVMMGLEPGVRAIMTLYAILPIALYAAVRFGPRGAISIAALGTTLVGLIGAKWGGAFLDIPWSERHEALQMFELTLVSIPLVIGSLIAERETRSRRAERILAWQADILELVATGRASIDVFRALVVGIENLLPAGLCSVVKLEGSRLRVSVAPSLPTAYCAAIDGVEIGPTVGSCGTAAHEGRTVVVEDIATDPRWQSNRDLARAHGLAACWAVPIRITGGEVLGTLAIYHAIPRRPAQHEIALVERTASLAAIALERERREGLLASISRNVKDGLYRCESGRGLVYVNEAFARMFGYGSPQELLAQAVSGRSAAKEHTDALARLTAGLGHPQPVEVQLQRRDGSSFWGLVSSSTRREDDGHRVTIDGAVLDVTDRKALEDQLRHAQKMEAVGQLAGGVAHDFNNLLTAIAGFAQMVRGRLPAGSPLHPDVAHILEATERATSLTRQLLAFSRQQVMTPQVFELAEVVEAFSDMLQRLIGEDIELVYRRGPAATTVRADRGQIEQVLLNVVLNARDAMPRGGVLTISTGAVEVDVDLARAHAELTPGPCVALSVRDTGVGMSPETLARAFDPFFTTKAPGKGTGIGLATVYGIVRQSGGAAWIESAEGAGTTVWIYLPRSAELPDPSPPRPAAAEPTLSAHVLLVEDEPRVREFVDRALATAGLTVVAVADAAAALEVARGHDGGFDILVTDVVMPQMGGPELAKRLRESWPDLPVLYVSGYSDDGQRLAESGSRHTAYLAKPFQSAELLARIAALLAGAEVADRRA